MPLTQTEINAFHETARRLAIKNPQWLIDLVRFESNFNPKAKNPYSSARGLIQFIDSTARHMGYTDSLHLVNTYPTVTSQLNKPVYDYLQPYAPFNQEFQLYMAVFFPAARKYAPSTPFRTIYRDIYGANWSERYATFKKQNPGILTPQDYVNYIKKKPGRKRLTMTGIVIGSTLLIWFLAKRKLITLPRVF
jgi:hypothetical protein